MSRSPIIKHIIHHKRSGRHSWPDNQALCTVHNQITLHQLTTRSPITTQHSQPDHQSIHTTFNQIANYFTPRISKWPIIIHHTQLGHQSLQAIHYQINNHHTRTDLQTHFTLLHSQKPTSPSLLFCWSDIYLASKGPTKTKTLLLKNVSTVAATGSDLPHV